MDSSAESLLQGNAAGPLVLLLGPKPITEQLVKAYEEGPSSKKYSINFPSFPLETKFSQFVKANTPTKATKQKGLLNLSWLKRYRQLVPSLAVAVFDYSNEDLVATKQPLSFYEHSIQEKHKELQYECALYGSALMTIVLINPKLAAPLDVDDLYSSFKKVINFDTKFFYVSFKGLSGLGPKLKKIAKIFEEQSQEFYREKRNRLKKKVSIREKFPSPQITLFKQQIKVAFLYENIHNRTNAHEHFKHAYDGIVGVLPQLVKAFDIWEIKGVADFLFYKLVQFYFSSNETKHVISLFRTHYSLFKQKLNEVEPKQLYLEYKWRAAHLKRVTDLLSNEIQAADLVNKKEVTMWVGFLHSACAKMLIQERETMERHNLRWDPERKKHDLPFDAKELADYEFIDSIFLGREKQCLSRAPNTSVEPDKASELVQRNKLAREIAVDFSNEIVTHIRETILRSSTNKMKSYLEYLILKEYKRQGKRGEYRMLKKKLVQVLTERRWTGLSAKILAEDSDFASDEMQEDSSGLAVEVQLDALATSVDEVGTREKKFQLLLEQIEGTATVADQLKYALRCENSLVMMSAYFDKNPVGTHDYTTLHFSLLPLIPFHKQVHHLMLNFSDESLDKIVYLGKEGVAPVMLDPKEKYEGSVVLYIKPGVGPLVELKSASLIVNLSNDKGTKLCFDMRPYEHSHNLLPQTQKTMQRVILKVVNSERVMNLLVYHKPPAFLSERYNVSLVLKPLPTYEITSALITISEVLESERSIQPREDSKPAGRKASVVSDSGSSDTADWNFILYAHKAGKENTAVTPENVDEVVEKLAQHHYTIQNIKAPEQLAPLYMQFREEGKKNFEVAIRYTAKKLMHDNTFGAEFVMENKEYFSIDVLCPFNMSCEWLAPEPSVGPSALPQSIASKARLTINKKATLSVKISTEGFQDVAIHDINLTVKEESIAKKLGCSGWTRWPLVIGIGEQFAASFALQPTSQFKDRQLGDVEIVWSRVNDKKGEKTVCSIPIWEVTATENCIDVSLEPPIKAVKLQEFNMVLKIRNMTATILETKLGVEENADFFIAGELSTFLTLPPYYSDEFRYTLVPLNCGKLDLPKPVVSMMSCGKVIDTISDKNLEQFIYVFPAQY